MTIGGVIAGIGGGIFAHYTTHIEHVQFGVILATFAIAYPILGGLSNVLGTLLAVIFIQGFLIEGLRFMGDWRNLLFGGLILLAMNLRPLDPAERVSLASAVVRWLLLAAPFGLASVAMTIVAGVADLVAAVAVSAWYVVLLVTTARHPAKQGLHDRLARTIMVKPARAVGTPAPSAQD